jgi:hypothetical protein
MGKYKLLQTFITLLQSYVPLKASPPINIDCIFPNSPTTPSPDLLLSLAISTYYALQTDAIPLSKCD